MSKQSSQQSSQKPSQQSSQQPSQQLSQQSSQQPSQQLSQQTSQQPSQQLSQQLSQQSSQQSSQQPSQKSSKDSRASSKNSRIKLAPQEAEKRTSKGGADPGPGDINAEPSTMPEPVELPEPPTANKKVTKFRYHKRITVKTKGKTNPTTVLAKVAEEDHRAGITMSTIDELDPSEIMKRAGIPPNKKAHWRVRMRQTKRITKDGKTTTQTKVAYRDSEGHKHVKTSSNPFCKDCGERLEDCKCDSASNASGQD